MRREILEDDESRITDSIASETHPHMSAHSGLTDRSLVSCQLSKLGDSLIVCCAPLSTNALIGCPFTSTGMLHNILDLLYIDIAIHLLKHDDLSETLRRVLHCVIEVLHDRFLPYSFLNLPLGLNIKGIRVQDFRAQSSLCFCGFVLLANLTQEGSESCRVLYSCIYELGICLQRKASGEKSMDCVKRTDHILVAVDS